MKFIGKRKSIWAFGLAVLMLAGSILPAGRAEAKAREVETAKYGWTWTFWGNTEDGEDEGTLRFGRCTDRATGEYLSKGWHLVDNHWYFFTDAGYAKDQFHDGYPLGDRIGLGTYEKEDTPVCYKWVQTDDGHWRYMKEDGSSYLKNRKAWINNQLYIFDENGYLPLKKGWWKDPATGAWYYIKPSLSCETGWRQLGKNWYFFDRCTGRMADWGTYDTRGAFSQKPVYYLFTSSGGMKKKAGWMKGSTGEWYYGNSDGTAVLGWVRSGGKDYYMDPGQGGRMATGGDSWSWYQDGRRIDTTGAAGSKTCKWQRGKRNTWWYGNDDMYVTGTVFIDSWGYEFDSEGYCVRGWRLSDGYEEVYIHKEAEEGVLYWDKPIEVSEADLYLLAATVYTEAGGEDYMGQVAVANVILNRLRSGKFGKTLSDVIYQPYQFSVVGTKTFRRCLIHGGSATSLKAAREALGGKNMIGTYDSFRMHEGYDLTKIKSEYMIHGCHVFYYYAWQ